jgi:hypothetical protein
MKADAPLVPRSELRGYGDHDSMSGSYYRVGDHLEFFVEVTDAVEGLLARAIGPLKGTMDNPDPAIDSAATVVAAVLDSLAQYHAPRR